MSIKRVRNKKASKLHIEQENAGYIVGDTREERNKRISEIWAHIESHIEHFRAPGHHPVSSPRLIDSTTLPKTRSELHIDHKPGRHILYIDTLDLLFYRSDIQARVEVKQRQRRGYLKEEFTEATIKIGNKANSRIEQEVHISNQVWEKSGFIKALYAGIEAKIKRVERMDGKEGAQIERAKLNEFKRKFKKALHKTANKKLDSLDIFPLVHLNRDTIETEYSPYDHGETILEVKTDDCDWETVLRHIGEYGQIEIEHIQGDPKYFIREFRNLMRYEGFGIEPTNDSKEHHGIKALWDILMPQNDTAEENARVQQNRVLLELHLKRCRFVSLDPVEIGINSTPAQVFEPFLG